MKKQIHVTVVCLIVIAALALVIIFVPLRDASALSLQDFYNGTEFAYREAVWGTDVKAVKKALPFRIVKDGSRGENDAGWTYYTAKPRFHLDGMEAVVTVELENDALRVVRFDFTADENYQAWFDAQAAALEALYGDDCECLQSQNGQLASTIYRCETDTSSLQLTLMTQKSGKPAITLGVAAK